MWMYTLLDTSGFVNTWMYLVVVERDLLQPDDILMAGV